MTEEARRRLGRQVAQRRRALGLTASDAARAASVNPKTWEALEKGTRATRDSNYAGIERALQWEHGSIEAVLEGRRPRVQMVPPLAGLAEEAQREGGSPVTDQLARRNEKYVDPETGESYTEEWERELWDLTRLDMAERRKLIYWTRAERQREQAERRRAAG